MRFSERELLLSYLFRGVPVNYFDVGDYDDEADRKNAGPYAAAETIAETAE